MELITVVIKQPTQPPMIRQIENCLQSLQSAVDGYIESCSIPVDGAVAYCNDEGLLDGLPENIDHPDYGLIVGTIIVTGVDEDGETISLTDKQVEEAIRVLSEMDVARDATNGN